MQLGEYPVVMKSLASPQTSFGVRTPKDVCGEAMKSYDHEFLKSNSVTNFSQNNAVENYIKYQKKQKSTMIMAWSLIIMEWA